MPEVELQHDGHPAYRRMVRFDWSDTPLHWVPDDPFATHMMNVCICYCPRRTPFHQSGPRGILARHDPELEARSNRSSSKSPGMPGPTRWCSTTWPSRASTPSRTPIGWARRCH